MLLPETKERELRFKLALRMGLPIFFLTVILAIVGLSDYFDQIPLSFYVTALVLLTVMVYFIFFLIYAGFEERITDPVSGMFSREYTVALLKKALKEGPCTIMLVSIDNLKDINERYGVQNGDRVLQEFSRWVGRFVQQKGVEKFPIGHFKGGDFFIALPGLKQEYASLLDLLCLKVEHFMVDDIELQMSGAVVDSSLSKDLDQLVDELFERQQLRRVDREDGDEEEEISPSELEGAVVAAVTEKRFSMMFQEVCEADERVMLEASIKLYGQNGKLIHQKKYLPVISRLGLARDYDLMLIERIIGFCREYAGRERLALPISPSTLRNLHFFKTVQMLLTENEAAKGRIVLILEEREYYPQTRRFNEMLQSYRRMGIAVALDRLGKNTTTMRYLRELDVDIVRYDMFFGKQLADRKVQALLRGLNLSARELGIKTWIRMIEDEESAKIAASIGVDLLQGNQIGTIAPLEAFTERNP